MENLITWYELIKDLNFYIRQHTDCYCTYGFPNTIYINNGVFIIGHCVAEGAIYSKVVNCIKENGLWKS